MSHKPRRKYYGLSKDGILVANEFSQKLSLQPEDKGKGLPTHVQLGFRKNLWCRACSDEMLMCVTKACMKTRFPVTSYSVISFKI